MTPKRVRERLKWSPAWDGQLQGIAAKYIRNNIWRCDTLHSFDDLMQDAYLTYVRMAARYPRVSEPAHFVALFKSALHNEMTDRARYRQLKLEATVDLGVDPLEHGALRIGDVTNDGLVSILMAEMPEEFKMALAMIESEPAKAPRRRPAKPKERENLNMRLSKALGLGTRYDFVGVIRSLLTA